MLGLELETYVAPLLPLLPRSAWRWAFSDVPEIITTPSAEHTFSSAGSHQVELQVTDANGAMSSTVITVEIDPNNPCVFCL